MGGFGTGESGALPWGSTSTDVGGGSGGTIGTPVTIVTPEYQYQSGNLRRVDYVSLTVKNPRRAVNEAVLSVAMTDGQVELIWRWDVGFTEKYRRGSARLRIRNGHRYILRRTDGWTTAILRIDVWAADLASA